MGRVAASRRSGEWKLGRAVAAIVRSLFVVRNFLWFGGFLDLHVAKFLGVKDVATLQALDKFGVFVPGNDTYPGVLADGCHRFGLGVDTFLFPQDCSGDFNFLERLFVESLLRRGRFVPPGGETIPDKA
jgi:hypothetical protein